MRGLTVSGSSRSPCTTDKSKHCDHQLALQAGRGETGNQDVLRSRLACGRLVWGSHSGRGIGGRQAIRTQCILTWLVRSSRSDIGNRQRHGRGRRSRPTPSQLLSAHPRLCWGRQPHGAVELPTSLCLCLLPVLPRKPPASQAALQRVWITCLLSPARLPLPAA